MREAVSKAAIQGRSSVIRPALCACSTATSASSTSRTSRRSLPAPEWAALNAQLASLQFGPERMAILRREAEDPNLAADARAAVRREIARLEKQAGRELPSVPSATPPPLPDGKPQSGVWYVDTLDPQTAWTMRNRAQADVHRMQAQNAASLADRSRIADAQVKAVAAMMKDGFAPAPDVLETTRRLAAGTPAEGALAEAQQLFTATSAFRVMPSAQRQAVLDQMRARGNTQAWTPQEASLFEALTKIDSQVDAAYKADPLRAALSQGFSCPGADGHQQPRGRAAVAAGPPPAGRRGIGPHG